MGKFKKSTKKITAELNILVSRTFCLPKFQCVLNSCNLLPTSRYPMCDRLSRSSVSVDGILCLRYQSKWIGVSVTKPNFHLLYAWKISYFYKSYWKNRFRCMNRDNVCAYLPPGRRCEVITLLIGMFVDLLLYNTIEKRAGYLFGGTGH